MEKISEYTNYIIEGLQGRGKAAVLIAVISAVMALLGQWGINFSKLALIVKDFKNRKTIKYVIVDKVMDENAKIFLRRALAFFLEASWTLVSMLSIYVLCKVHIYLYEEVEKGKSIYWYLFSFLIVSVVIGIIIYVVKKKITKKVEKVVVSLLGMTDIVILLVIISIIIKKVAIIFLLMAIETVIIIGTAIYILQTIGWYRDNKGIGLNVCRITRYLLVVMEIVEFFLQIEYTNKWDVVISNVIFFLVFFMAWIEYIVINMTDKSMSVNVILHMNDGEDKVTKEKVIQYDGEKVKVRRIDGIEEILNLDQIKNISYSKSCSFSKKATKTNKVKCILKNGEVQMFSHYQMKNDKWIMFSKTENGVRDVIFLKTDDIIKIENKRKI